MAINYKLYYVVSIATLTSDINNNINNKYSKLQQPMSHLPPSIA